MKVWLLVVGFFLAGVADQVALAQVSSAPYFRSQKNVAISFTDDIDQANLSNILIFFEDDDGSLIQIWGDATKVTSNRIDITNFRAQRSGAESNFDLEAGGGGIRGIPSGKTRTYTFVVKGLKLSGEARARPVQAMVDVSSSVGMPPQLFMADISNRRLPYDRGKITVAPFGIPVKALLDRFKSDPGQIRISYGFAADDPAPNVETSAANIIGNPDGATPTELVIEPQEKLPLRAKRYTVKVQFPVHVLRQDVEQGWEIPSDANFIVVSRSAELLPSTQYERAKTQLYLETTYSSTVAAATGRRSHVGIFGIHWKPTLPLLTYNVDGEKGSKPIWMAIRPLLEADFDTQSVRASKSPNRIQFGLDYELGRDAGLQTGGLGLVQQIVWLNGMRYDSDRDFKLQTLYWHTEFIPRFLYFEQTTEMRQFKYDMDTRALEATGRPSVREGVKVRSKGPFVSAYRIRPSLGYELGGIVRRDIRPTDFPTNTISRAIVGLDLSLELRRLVTLAFNNTYYFLENAPRRRHRDYLEARFELNTGYLFNRNFNGLQNALLFKFQRGDQPPRFGPVNALSVGFKIFQ